MPWAPRVSSDQNAAGSLVFPGNRQAMPITAIGSRLAASISMTRAFSLLIIWSELVTTDLLALASPAMRASEQTVDILQFRRQQRFGLRLRHLCLVLAAPGIRDLVSRVGSRFGQPHLCQQV